MPKKESTAAKLCRLSLRLQKQYPKLIKCLVRSMEEFMILEKRRVAKKS
jgi:hypothetical protein